MISAEAPVNDAAVGFGPGNLDEEIHDLLADNDPETGDIRGHGRLDAPGHNK